MSADATGTAPASPARTTVATYSEYRDAERAVDFLSDKGFPIERSAIIGTGLRTVEQIAGRTTTARAGLLGAAQGALIGLFFALLLGIFFTIDQGFFGLLVYAVVLGALFGATFAALGHAMQGGRRDFTSVSGMQAASYELQVDYEVSAEAKQLLGELPSG